MRGVVFGFVIAFLTSEITAQVPRVRDSAGVRIVENGPRLTAPIAFELAANPTFDYGGLQQDPADELSDRNPYPYAIRLASGNVVILDRTRVVFVDPSGKRIKAVGRQGRGPGEFVQTTNLCATRGDTVLVGQGRMPVTKLSKDGELAAVIPVPEGGVAEGAMCFDDGTFSLLSRRNTGGDVSVYRFTRVGPSGALNTIVDHEYPPFDMAVRMYNPIVAAGDRMYFFNGNAYEIKVFGRDGRLIELIRTADSQMPLSDDLKNPTAFRAGSSQAEIEAARRRAIANSRTKYVPTVRRMFIDLAKRIWVEDWQVSEDPAKESIWTAFDATGRIVGRLVIPGAPKQYRRWIAGFGKEEVIFSRLDDDGAVHYTAYPIVPIKR